MGNINKQYPLFFLYLTLFVNMIGFSMVFPLLPFYAQNFNATPLQIGFLAASHALANFIASPILGRISDRVGRRPVLIIGLLSATLSMSLMGFANSLWMLLAGRIAHGAVAAAIVPSARAYMGDVTTGSQRIAAMGKVGAALSSGLLFGPSFASFLVSIGGIHAPFFAAAAVSLFNAISVFIFLPESLKEKAHKVVIKEGLLNAVTVFKHLKGSYGILFLVLFAWSFALSNKQLAFPLLAGEKFNIGADSIGYFFTGTAIVSIIMQGYLLPKIVKFLGEKRTLLLGMSVMAISVILIPFSPTLLTITLTFLLMGMGSNLNRPVAEGIISRETHTGQGTTFGVAHSFESLGRVAGPTLAGALYGIYAPTPFLLSGIMLLTLGFLVLTTFKIKAAKVENI